MVRSEERASLWYGLGGFFALFLLVVGASEGAARLSGQEGMQAEAQARAEALAEQLAKAGAGGAAQVFALLPPGSKAWLVEEEAPKPGQLASLRKRKVTASTEAGEEGKAPSKEVALEAAAARARALEGQRAAASALVADAEALRASAPLISGQTSTGAAILLIPFQAQTPPSPWMPSLGSAFLAALAAALLLRRPPGAARGALLSLSAALFVALLWFLYAAFPPAQVTALIGGLFALSLAYWAGSGGLSLTWSAVSQARYAYAYVAPAMLGMFVLVFVPFAVGAGLSLFEHEFGQWRFVGLDNFVDIVAGGARAITSPDSFFYKLGVTLLWTTSNVFFHVAIGLGLALLLNQSDLKGKGFYRVVLILPWAVPSYITALIWKRMFHPTYGAVNALLGTEGLSWTDSFWKAFAANLATNIWLGVPFMMVTCLGALQSIPKDIYEAAALDGASAWRRFWSLTLPLLRPALLPAVILGMIWTFNMFNVIYLVSEGKPGGATDILVTEAYRYAFERQERGGEYGYAAAYSTIIFLLLLVYSFGTAKATGLTKGAE